MLHPIQGYHQPAQISLNKHAHHPSGGGNPIHSLPRPSATFSFYGDEWCEECNGLGQEEEISVIWGEMQGYDEATCSGCNGTGLSLLGRIMEGLAGQADPWPMELV